MLVGCFLSPPECDILKPDEGAPAERAVVAVVVRRDDPLAAAGEEEGVADLVEGLEVVGVDRGVGHTEARQHRRGGEEEGGEGGGEIHGGRSRAEQQLELHLAVPVEKKGMRQRLTTVGLIENLIFSLFYLI